MIGWVGVTELALQMYVRRLLPLNVVRRLSSSFGTYGSCISIPHELHKGEVLCNRFARLLKVPPPFQGHRRYSAIRPGHGDFL
jgi:hypothetical protein